MDMEVDVEMHSKSQPESDIKDSGIMLKHSGSVTNLKIRKKKNRKVKGIFSSSPLRPLFKKHLSHKN